MSKLGLEKKRNQKSNGQHLQDHRESKGIPEKNVYLCFINYAKAFDCVDRYELWKGLEVMEIADHLTCLLRILYEGQEVTVRTLYGTND